MFGFWNQDYVPRRHPDTVVLHLVRIRRLAPTKWAGYRKGASAERYRQYCIRHASRHKRRLMAWRRRERLAHPKVAWERGLLYA